MEIKRETRGRKSLAVDKKKPPQATVKINSFILPFVKQLKGNLKKGLVTENTLSLLFGALKEKGEQLSVFKDPDAVTLVGELQEKIRLLEAEKQIIEVKLRDREALSFKSKEVIAAESKVRSTESSYRLLKIKYEELLHKEHACMAIKTDGVRCTRVSKIDFEQNGLMIRVCSQHSKSLKI